MRASATRKRVGAAHAHIQFHPVLVSFQYSISPRGTQLRFEYSKLRLSFILLVWKKGLQLINHGCFFMKNVQLLQFADVFVGYIEEFFFTCETEFSATECLLVDEIHLGQMPGPPWSGKPVWNNSINCFLYWWFQMLNTNPIRFLIEILWQEIMVF